MADDHCRTCFKPLPEGRLTCLRCDDESSASHRLARLPLVLGSIGLPLLVAGILAFDARLCLAGGLISTAAVLAHVLIVIWRAAA